MGGSEDGLAAALLLPVDQTDEPVGEEDLRFEGHRVPREADVRERVANVARALRAVLGSRRSAEDQRELAVELVQRRRLAGRDVDAVVADAVADRGVEHGADDVIDVDEVARLLTISEDGHRLVAQQAVDEDADDPGVRTRRILPRSVHVEEAQPDRRETVQLLEDAGVVLARELLDGVRAERPRLLALVRRRALPGNAVPVDRGAAREDDALHRVLAGCEQDVQSALQVRMERSLGPPDRLRDRGHGGQMEHEVEAVALHGLANRTRVTHICTDQVDVRTHRDQVLLLPG